MNKINSDFIHNNQESIDICISSFDVSTNNYRSFTPKMLGIKGDSSNTIYLKDSALPQGIEILFTEKARNCNVVINSGFTGRANRFSLKNENNFLYLGKDLNINKVSAVILGVGDAIMLGDGISVTADNSWSTGFNSGVSHNGLIIGDHCLIASEVVIRPADGHIVFDTESGKQTNISHSPVIIEPYCWISQRAAILKNVKIGACSIISFAAVATKTCERFSCVVGVPGKSIPLDGRMWLRGRGKEAKKILEIYLERFGTGKITANSEISEVYAD